MRDGDQGDEDVGRREAGAGEDAAGQRTELRVPLDLQNFYVSLSSFSDKLPLLIRSVLRLRTCRHPQKVLVFFSTCAQVDYFSSLIERYLAHACPSAAAAAEGEREDALLLLKLHRKHHQRKAVFQRFMKAPRALLLCTDIMARGIDIQNVQWVLHFDLPNSLEAYVHRSGRSGHRLGEKGCSLLFVLPHEQSFVDLCHQKRIGTQPLTQQQFLSRISVAGDAGPGIQIAKDELSEWIKDEARQEQQFYELGIQAFVSFVRTYASKSAVTVFPDADVIDLVNSYGLLKLPVMPEYRKRMREYQATFRSFMKPQDSLILQRYREAHEGSSRKGGSDARSRARADARLRRSKTRNKINSTRLKGKEKKALIDEMEMRELAADARVVKKLKRGRISEAKFDEHFGI